MFEYEFLVAYQFSNKGLSGFGRAFITSRTVKITSTTIETWENLLKQKNSFSNVVIVSFTKLDKEDE